MTSGVIVVCKDEGSRMVLEGPGLDPQDSSSDAVT